MELTVHTSDGRTPDIHVEKYETFLVLNLNTYRAEGDLDGGEIKFFFRDRLDLVRFAYTILSSAMETSEAGEDTNSDS
jgi:hypothetical protein